MVSYPGFGSLWLEDAEIVDGSVVGMAWEPIDGYPTGGAYVTMNFPLSCVRKWEPPLEEAQ